MPAPVEFTISIASLPPGFSGDPQALATAIAARLSISPSEPWSSFINGGAQPAADSGPYLKNGQQWKVWDTSSGTYIDHVQDGAGVVAATIPRSKLSADTPNTVWIIDAAGRPQLISGTLGQVVTATATVPVFANPATGNCFNLQVTTNQTYVSDGAYKQVQFDLTSLANGVTPDLAGFRIPVTAGSIWHLGASLQIAQINGTHTNVQHFLAIRPYQNSGLAFGATDGYTAAQLRNGVQCSGVYQFINAGYVDVVIATTADTSAVNFAVENNGTNTRFFGFRLM